MKKTLYIIIIILITAAIGFGIYWFFDMQQRGAGSTFNFANYLPFGKAPETSTGNTNGGQNGSGTNSGTNNGNGSGNTGGNGSGTANNGSNSTISRPQLSQISTDPQSGAVIFQKKNDVSTYVRYLDKATGNVFESDLSNVGKKRVSNTTIPKVYEASWLADGNSLILRYISDNTSTIKSLSAKLIAPAGVGAGATSTQTSTEAGSEDLQELRGTFLPIDISALAVAPSQAGQAGTEKVFYMLPDDIGGTAGYISNADGSKPALIFDSPLKEWLASWTKSTTITLNTKPSADIPGYAYFLDAKTGTTKKILGGISGLTTLTNPDATRVLFSEGTSNGLALGVFTLKTDKKQALSHITLPEKCVWSAKDTSIVYCAAPKSLPNTKYPDSWYQGVISFNDVFWKINTETGQAEILIDPRTTAKVEIDAVNLTLDSRENYLVFTNKKDYQLWSLKLLENSGT